MHSVSVSLYVMFGRKYGTFVLKVMVIVMMYYNVILNLLLLPNC